MKRQHYCAVIGDINDSRRLQQRARIQKKFQEAIAAVNREFRNGIAARFVITLGDEFQGLVFAPEDGYRLIGRFRELMGDVPFAFGLGDGTLSTAMDGRLTNGMDGECFHRARAALRLAKLKRRGLVFDADHAAIPALNALVGLMEKQRSRMTPRQREIARLLIRSGSQKTVARKLGISPQAVSKAALSGALKQLAEAEEAIGGFLASLRTR
jgi:hypothetical protein